MNFVLILGTETIHYRVSSGVSFFVRNADLSL